MNIKNLKINSFKLEMKSLHHKKLKLKKKIYKISNILQKQIFNNFLLKFYIKRKLYFFVKSLVLEINFIFFNVYESIIRLLILLNFSFDIKF